MQAKVCGLTTTEQVETCVSYGANFCGFILNYQKSHRFINYQVAKKLTEIKQKTRFLWKSVVFSIFLCCDGYLKLKVWRNMKGIVTKRFRG